MSDPIDDFRGLEAVTRLGKDIKKAAQTLSPFEARYLVDHYYSMQDNRIRSSNQVRELTKSEEPHQTIAWLADNAAVLERSIASALDAYSRASVVGMWARSICGIGPVLTAGLLAHIDITKAPTAGHIWSFAGYNPTVTWMLPPAHIHSRAKRWAVKIVLAHYQAVAYRDHFGTDAPKPYILTREGGHAHEILVPNWPFDKKE
jgi:hypothetical protein